MSGSSGSSGGYRGSSGTPPATGVALTPKSLLRRHNLPIAAHLHTHQPPPGLDLARPLLLYTNYTSTKVRAVSLRTSHDGALQAVGPPLVIPDSYTGWFAVVTTDGRTAPYYTTVEQLVSAQLTFFLTRYDVPAYVQYEDDLGRFSYDRTVIQSGHVLKLLGVYEDLNARRGIFAPRDINNVFNCDKYAQCLNYRNQVVFLPFSASGRFYAPAHKSSKDPSHVYLMTQLLKNYKLPLTVKLVCGYMPRVPCSFTGMLRLEKARKEAVILACTMTSEAQATLLEIEVTSNFVLSPIMDQLFSKTPIFLKTVSYCQDEGDAWRRQIKVTHHVTENRSRSLTRSLSDKFVEPLTRPLNLSFLADLDRRRGNSKERNKENNKRENNRWIKNEKNKDIGKYTISDKSSYRRRQSNNLKQKTKQNTYILQVPRIQRSLPEEPIEEINNLNYEDSDSDDDNGLYNRLSKSVDNIDYCRVLDDISPIPEKSEDEEEDEDAAYQSNDENLEEEDHYAEISEIPINSEVKNTNELSITDDLDRISHVSFGDEDDEYVDSGSNETAHIDFEDDRSLDQISLDMFERDGRPCSNSDTSEKLTQDEIRELGGTPSMLKANNSTTTAHNNLITVEAVIHENKENESIEKNLKNVQTSNLNDKNKLGEEVSLIRIGNYDVPKPLHGKLKSITHFDSYPTSVTMESIPEDTILENSSERKNNIVNDECAIVSNPNVDNRINIANENKLASSEINPSRKESSDFNGNEIKIVLKGNTIVIKVKDDESDLNKLNFQSEKENKTQSQNNIQNQINSNITRTILADDDKNSCASVQENFSKLQNIDEINKDTETCLEKTIMNNKNIAFNETGNINSNNYNSQEELSSETQTIDSSDSVVSLDEICSSSGTIESAELQDDNDSDSSSLISVSDSGIYFIKLKGFELPESEIGKALTGNAIDRYDSLC